MDGNYNGITNNSNFDCDDSNNNNATNLTSNTDPQMNLIVTHQQEF